MKVRRELGLAMTEALLALPLLLLFALGVIQLALLFEARAMLSLALHDGARAGSIANASTLAIESALARTLVPLVSATTTVQERDRAVQRSAQLLALGQQEGWIHWRQISPTAAGFADWATDARDDNGYARGTGRELTVDNLSHRIRHQLPHSGTSGFQGAEPVGAASAQTLAQATLLKLELRYGVPLVVPAIGPLFAWIMRQYDGCAAAHSKRLGTLVLTAQAALPRVDWCPFYQGSDLTGRLIPRWPMQLAATIRLQSAVTSAPR
jgi:TadE-like protein